MSTVRVFGSQASRTVPTRVSVLALFLLALSGCGGGGHDGAANALSASTAASTSSACACVPPPSNVGAQPPPRSVTPVPSVLVPATAPTNRPAGPPTLIGATYRDQNGSRAIDAGDVLVLRFDRPVRLSGFEPGRELTFGTGDDAGTGAAGAVDPARREDVLVTLGSSARLALFQTYTPGAAPGAGKTPARVALAKGRKADAVQDASSGAGAQDAPPVPVYADAGSRFTYQGRTYAETSPSAAHAFYGNLHAHTGFSDGKDDPAVAFDYARNTAGLDFMCTTDHLEQLTQAHWDETLRVADQKDTPGKFVTLVGFEWGHGYQPPLGWYNHINAIGTRHRVSVANTISVLGFYKEAVDLCLPDGAVGKFNHPYINKPPLKYNQWDDFAYDARADLFMRLIRVQGHGSKQTKELGYLPALEKGWHVSPTSSQDNHRADWGAEDERRTGVWLERLDRQGLMKALAEGRTFSTDDRNATIRLLADGAIWMGSTVARTGSIALTAEVVDPDASDGFARLELWGRRGAVLASADLKGATSGKLDLTVDPAEDSFFWARAIQADGEELFSAPIFVDR